MVTPLSTFDVSLSPNEFCMNETSGARAQTFTNTITCNHQSLLFNTEQTKTMMSAKVTLLDFDASRPPVAKSSKMKHVATHETLEPIRKKCIAIQQINGV